MKKKIIKITAIILSAALILTALIFANAFFGNPVSKLIATNTAEKHIAEVYPDTDYYIDDVRFNFKTGDYHAFIKSPTSVDTEFSLYITMTGELRLDTYDDVLDGFNTARRLDDEYRALAEEIFSGESFPYTCYISYGTLEIHPGEYIDSGYDDIPVYAINQNELELDKEYDIRELGRKAGRIVVYVDSDTVTVEKTAEVMLGIKEIFDSAELPFAAMDIVLQYPKAEDSTRPDGEVRLESFPYDEIEEKGLVEKVKAADKQLKEYYEKLDKENEKLTPGNAEVG